MPYLTYETAESRMALKRVVAETRNQTPSHSREISEMLQPSAQPGSFQDKRLPNETKSSGNPNEKLVQGYLMTPTSWNSQSLHIRRTLDQFFFRDLPDVDKGSADDDVDDQTVGRYAKRNGLPLRIFMVDQLWLWIMDESAFQSSSVVCLFNLILTALETIITSFPQNWHQDPNHPGRRDVLKSIDKVLSQVDRDPLLSVYDLAALIVLQCTAVFDRNAIKGSDLQFLDMFDASIEDIVCHPQGNPTFLPRCLTNILTY
jgi:hypothetical protein